MTRIVMVVLLIFGLGVAAQASQESPRTPPAAKVSASGLVNLNTASVTQLETLPGIGKSTAERILEYREKSGGFKKIEDLREAGALMSDRELERYHEACSRLCCTTMMRAEPGRLWRRSSLMAFDVR